MKISDLFGLACRNLVRRIGRTALTVVGVVVGSCAVIVMISLGLAQSASYEEMLASQGDLTQIQVYNFGHSVGVGNTATPDLTDEQLAKINGWEHVEAVSPFYQPYMNGTIAAGRGGRYTTDAGCLLGVYMGAMPSMSYTLTSGSWPSDTQSYGKNKLPVVLADSAAYMFEDSRRSQTSSKRYRYEGMTDASGNELPPFVDFDKDEMTLTITNGDTENPKTQSWELVVVGRVDLSNKGFNSGWYSYAIGMRISDLKMVQEAYKKLTGEKNNNQTKGYDSIYVKVDDINSVDEVAQKLTDMGYSTYSMTEQRNAMRKQVARSQLTLGGLAAISLLVAALNIANTMTMAIYERTKEIGVMKVLGCKLNDIRIEFLMESGAMGMIGGVIGGVISIGISLVLNNITMIAAVLGLNIDVSALTGSSDSVYYVMMGGGDTSMVISIVPWWLLLATLIFATVIGLLSGLGPANKAVRISALEAISHG